MQAFAQLFELSEGVYLVFDEHFQVEDLVFPELLESRWVRLAGSVDAGYFPGATLLQHRQLLDVSELLDFDDIHQVILEFRVPVFGQGREVSITKVQIQRVAVLHNLHMGIFVLVLAGSLKI